AGSERSIRVVRHTTDTRRWSNGSTPAATPLVSACSVTRATSRSSCADDVPVHACPALPLPIGAAAIVDAGSRSWGVHLLTPRRPRTRTRGRCGGRRGVPAGRATRPAARPEGRGDTAGATCSPATHPAPAAATPVADRADRGRARHGRGDDAQRDDAQPDV